MSYEPVDKKQGVESLRSVNEWSNHCQKPLKYPHSLLYFSGNHLVLESIFFFQIIHSSGLETLDESLVSFHSAPNKYHVWMGLACKNWRALLSGHIKCKFSSHCATSTRNYSHECPHNRILFSTYPERHSSVVYEGGSEEYRHRFPSYWCADSWWKLPGAHQWHASFRLSFPVVFFTRGVGGGCNFDDVCISGDIPDLFSDEEVDTIVTSVRTELRGLGLLDTRDNCWSFFIERIRRQLKVRIIS